MTLREKIEEIVGDAYEIGHAHGMAPSLILKGKKPQKSDEGWGPKAEAILSLITADREAHGKALLEAVKEKAFAPFFGWQGIVNGLNENPDVVWQKTGWNAARQAMIDADRIYREGI